jgi:glucoamylase
MMLSTWIEAAAKGRHGGQVRAGMWSAVVVGTHPIEADQEVWLELNADDSSIGPLPAFWIENKGVNSLWHVPIPPQAVNVRLHYRAWASRRGESASSRFQDTIVRPNLPDKTESPEAGGSAPEGLVGNQMMTVRVDSRGSTHDVYFPTVGLHSDIRPAEGELPQSRSHFRAIVAGLALGRRLDWFSERLAWGAFQHYQGATNLLMTELTWRHGPFRVLATDFVAKGKSMPRTAGGTETPGQYIKRFRILNEGPDRTSAMFGLYVQAEVNGGIGETGLSWHDQDRTLLAINRGHGHVNRKLARDATVEFAIALDDRGEVQCEPTGPNEAILLRKFEIPAGESILVDVLVSGAFTGWRGDPGTFEHWLKPALQWFRSTDLDLVEQATAQEWDSFVEPLPSLNFPKPGYAVSLRRSSLAAALHADEQWGAIASGFDRGLSAYCWPREAVWVGGAMDRAGHPEIGRRVYQWLAAVKGQTHAYSYWFQKYTIDGQPEWETPAIDQTAMVPWGVERHYRRTGDRAFVVAAWPIVERAASVCEGVSGHPGLRWIEDLNLVSSAGIWDSRFGSFLYSNAVVVAGLRAASRLARLLDREEQAIKWDERATRIWESGILGESAADGEEAGLVDHATGRFLEARRLSTLKGWWSEKPENSIERSQALDISMLGLVVPFGLLPAADPRIRSTAEAIYRQNAIAGDANFFVRWSPESSGNTRNGLPTESHAHALSSLATLWMARYLIRLGRETGEGRIWNLALSILDALLARLGPLGISLRAASRGGDLGRTGVDATSGVWDLQSMLIETMLDLTGLEYDAPDRRLELDPTLPGAWPHIGLSRKYPCGEINYRLERPIGATVHRLTLQARLDHPVRLAVGVTCPGLGQLGPWSSEPETATPTYKSASSRLEWSIDLPEGESSWVWTWG